jgi:hypothetical protein
VRSKLLIADFHPARRQVADLGALDAEPHHQAGLAEWDDLDVLCQRGAGGACHCALVEHNEARHLPTRRCQSSGATHLFRRIVRESD